MVGETENECMAGIVSDMGSGRMHARSREVHAREERWYASIKPATKPRKAVAFMPIACEG